LVAAHQAQIFLFDGDRLTFGAASPAGSSGGSLASPLLAEWTASIARLGARDLIPDISRHPLFKDQASTGALIGLPLCRGQQMLGVMVLAFSQPHLFDPDELRILELLADQAAVLLGNAQQYAESQDRAHQLASALAQLREFDRLKDEFIQNVSHELRTPMAIVRGYAELLDSGELGELQPEQRGPVSIIARRTRLLTRILDDLLAILEVEANQIRGEPVDLAGLVQSLLPECAAGLERAGLTLTAEIPSNLPPISGNSVHLRRMLDNLIGNAIKFTPAGGSIAVCLHSEGQDVLLEVADTGIGIPADLLDRIFDRFYQVNGATTRRYGGAGLGLALVKEIVEAHGGQVRVSSVLGKGSSFQVVLPTWDQRLQ
jgi:signal transduction histidine kinase